MIESAFPLDLFLKSLAKMIRNRKILDHLRDVEFQTHKISRKIGLKICDLS